MIKTAAALALTVAAATAQAPRIAVVRANDILQKLDGTVQANEHSNSRKAEILRDSRIATYNELFADLQLRRKALAEKPSKIDSETRSRLLREYMIKLQEAKSVLDDFEQFRTERIREIESEAVAGMKTRLARIVEVANKIAIEDGYDWVLDTSGSSNTRVPVLLYSKNPNDLTDRVLAICSSEQPAPPVPTPAPHPTATK